MNEAETSLGTHYLQTAIRDLQKLKTLAEKSIVQVRDDSRLHATLDKESNSIAIIVRHLSGNMVSRWTDFPTSDGEKPTRNRDGEFDADVEMTRGELMEAWDRGWACLFEALSSLKLEDLPKKVYIRGKEHTVVEAISRQFSHYSYHVGQIVFLAKHLEWERWESLSIPRRKPSRRPPEHE